MYNIFNEKTIPLENLTSAVVPNQHLPQKLCLGHMPASLDETPATDLFICK